AMGRPLDVPVGEACSRPLLAIPTMTPVNVAAYVMSSRHVRRLPVAEGEGLAGIVTARDLVEAYAQ
ncbi:MAG TPA: CBS domain-containing protein, partial [Candidatus Bathyarchaeia archaeon]